MAENQRTGMANSLGTGSKADFTNKLQASGAASDANRDQNFDGTRQAGKDTLDGKQRAQVPGDSAAESSQLSNMEMQGPRSMGPSGSVENVAGSLTVADDHPQATETKYYKSSYPTFTFRYGRGGKASFKNYYLVTNNADVQFYIEKQLMHNTGMVQVQESSKSEYDNDRRIPEPMVVPVFEPLPNQGELDKGRVRQVALHAKAPRTANNPDLVVPETGNGQKDHMTQFTPVQTDNLDQPIVDDRVVQPMGQVEQARAAKEQAAAEGAKPATDTKANPAVPAAQQDNKQVK